MNAKSYKHGPPAVVVGLSVTGLGTVRSLAEAGIQVIGVDSSFDIPSARTRYCNKVACPDIENEDRLLETLIGISKKSQVKPVLFLSTDTTVLIVSENREILRDYYHFNLPSKSSVRTLMDKTLFSGFAEKNGFHIPQTFVASVSDNIHSIAKSIQYPCVIKPSFRKPAWDKATTIKVFKVSSREELINAYRIASLLADKFVIQELIPGPDKEIYFCLLWYNSCAQPIASFTGKKIMQWKPELGSTCIAESCIHAEGLLEESIRLFNSLNYKGVGSVEFKKDSRDNAFKIVEPTVGRADLQSAIARHRGINIPLLEYCDCLGLKPPELTKMREDKIWVHEENLLWLLANERKRYSMQDWIRVIRSRKHYALFCLTDMRPFFHFLLRLFSTMLSKRRTLAKPVQ